MLQNIKFWLVKMSNNISWRIALLFYYPLLIIYTVICEIYFVISELDTIIKIGLSFSILLMWVSLEVMWIAKIVINLKLLPTKNWI